MKDDEDLLLHISVDNKSAPLWIRQTTFDIFSLPNTSVTHDHNCNINATQPQDNSPNAS